MRPSNKLRQTSLFGLTSMVVLALAGCQGGGPVARMANSNSDQGRPLQLMTTGGDQGELEGSVRQPINGDKLAKAVERHRLNLGEKKGPYRSVGVDLNGDGQVEALTLQEGDSWCAKTGCTLLVFTPGDTGYRPVATIRRVWAPIVVTSERQNGWSNLLVNTGLKGEREQRVLLRFGTNGYPGNAITQTPLPPDIQVPGEVVIEKAGVGSLSQELVSNAKP